MALTDTNLFTKSMLTQTSLMLKYVTRLIMTLCLHHNSDNNLNYFVKTWLELAQILKGQRTQMSIPDMPALFVQIHHITICCIFIEGKCIHNNLNCTINTPQNTKLHLTLINKHIFWTLHHRLHIPIACSIFMLIHFLYSSNDSCALQSSVDPWRANDQWYKTTSACRTQLMCTARILA